MAFPAYVKTRIITAGGASVLESGETLPVVITVAANRSLIWAETGYRFEANGVSANAAAGFEVAVPVPVTDMNGWMDATTKQLIDVSAEGSYSHQYIARVQVGATTYSYGPFVLPEGDGSPVDLDLLLTAGTVAGGQVSVPDSWSAIVTEAQVAAQAAEAAVIDSAAFVNTTIKDNLTPEAAAAIAATPELSAAIGGAVGPVPQMGALVRALDAGRSAAFSVFGDSTGDSDGSTPAQDRLAARFARRLCAAYPNHHVLFKLWNPTTEDFGAWVTMQAQAAGRRHAIISTRSLRYRPADIADVALASGNVDVRALVSFPNLVPSATQTIVSAGRKEVGGVQSNELQWQLRLHTSGNLYFRRSENGAAWQTDRISTVPLSSAASVDTPIWVRAVQEVTPGTGFTVKFYTSPDGITWTQLGTTLTGGSAATTATYQGVQGSYFEVGGDGWQPVASPFTGGKVYEVQIRDGVDGPMVAPAAVERWERYGDPATTYGGAPTLYVLNASRSGSDMSYHTDATRLKKETPDYGQVAAIFNDGHNETTKTGSLWLPPYEAWVSAVLDRLPNAAVIVVGQNPHTSAWANEATYGPEHVTRIMELSAAAGNQGWAFANAYQAYLDDPRGLGVLVSADGLHPTQTGYQLSGDTLVSLAHI